MVTLSSHTQLSCALCSTRSQSATIRNVLQISRLNEGGFNSPNARSLCISQDKSQITFFRDIEATSTTQCHRRSQGCTGFACTPRANKLFGKIYRGNCKCTPGRAKVQFFEEIGEIWTAGVVNLVVLACVLRPTTKKCRQLFEEESAPQRKSWLRL